MDMRSDEGDHMLGDNKTDDSDDSPKETKIYTSNRFTTDRSCISTLPQNEQEAELSTLDVEVYNQETLEKEILNQVHRAFENETKRNNDELIQECKGKGECNTNEFQMNDFSIYEQEETTKNKKIRMGEMTPFGTVMSLKVIEGNHFENIEEYLKNQIKISNEQKNIKGRCSRLKRGAVKLSTKDTSKSVGNNCIGRDATSNNNKKNCLPDSNLDVHTKQIKTKTQKNGSSSGSEYLPSESEEEDDIELKYKTSKRSVKEKKLQKISRNERNISSDSEIECSNKGRIKGEKDDGNESNYLKRLTEWEKENCREEVETQLQDLGAGYKVPLIIWNKLFNYQRLGVQWLWELNLQQCGGIVGDEMGLGKTVQVIAFLAGLSTSKLLSKTGNFRGLGPVLIISPTTIMHQWVKEFHQWWPQFRVALLHESGTYNGKKRDLIKDIVKANGILITSYVTYVQRSDDLLRHIWHYAILDEGHKIRNPDSQITAAVKLLRTPHRLILSGSPIQNNLKELWSLFDFIFPGKLGTLPVFLAEFGVPITQGGFVNASKVQVATAYKCATVLRDTISPYILRRIKEDVKNHINLPPKNEQVLFCKLTEKQKQLYIEYLNSGKVNDMLCGKIRLFVGLIDLRKICNHPDLYIGESKFSKRDNECLVSEEEEFGFWKKAGKMIVLETLLRIWRKQGHRVLVFTQSRKMLNILENFVRSQKYEYIRLDGSTAIGRRQPMINTFNEDKKFYIFLSTTHVGGLGVNLTGANRVVIYDPDWNPATDVQARERAWRVGQENQVTIYRLVTSGTIEEKIYHRQIYKQFLTNKVLKDPSQRRFFKSNDLYELFTFKGDDGTNETSAIFAGTNVELNLKNLSKRKRLKKYNSEEILEPKSMKIEVEAQTLLTKEKIEKMKRLAQALSRKITMDNLKPEKSETENLQKGQKESKNEKLNSEIVAGGTGVERCRKKSRGKGNDYEYLDGEVIPHLKKKKRYRDVIKQASNEVKHNHEKDDDYILKKLLSKSGVQSALQHDQLMELGSADYALIEGEAEKVAKAAVEALKESRRHYAGRQYESCLNVISKPRFGKKTQNRKISSGCETPSKNEQKLKMTSQELLVRIRQRNGLSSSLSNNPVDSNCDLLTDIRNFISYGADTENRATTQEIINKFKDRLPTGQTPLFKALLNEICEFHRTSRGEGIWQLRQDFLW